MSLIADELHERQTSAFIDANPADIVISRAVREDDGAGGERLTGYDPLPAQRVRIVGLRSPRVSVTPDGREIVVQKVLVGLPTFDVQIDDRVTINGVMFQVVNVSRDPNWRISAEVSSRG